MRAVRIVSDSSSDLSTLSVVDFAYAPMKVITAEREFVDDPQLNVEEMVQYLSTYKGKSQSSCPNPNDWLEAFGDADDVFCVTITGGLSGSYNTACAAKDLYESENEGKRVFVLDSLSAGPEVTLLVKKLEELIQKGLRFEEVCTAITEYRKNTGLLFMLKSLKNFANNGRVSPLVAKIVGVAGICIVGKASEEGTLDPAHKCRGEIRSLETIVSDLKKFGLKNGKVSIGHCYNEKAALSLKEKIKEHFPNAKTEIHPLRGLCSFYAELGGLLVGYEKQ